MAVNYGIKKTAYFQEVTKKKRLLNHQLQNIL